MAGPPASCGKGVAKADTLQCGYWLRQSGVTIGDVFIWFLHQAICF
jgi:hypothetical protein